MPLYLLNLGAKNEANAMSWMAISLVCLGTARLVCAPLWGLLSDRFGRKAMLLRSLGCLALTSTLFGIASAPWQVVIILTAHGMLSGYDGPGVALLSVSVPEAELRSSLAMTTSAKFIGQTIGPAIGAVLALALGYRGAVFGATFVAIMVTIGIALFAPNDRIAHTDPARASIKPSTPFKPSKQFWFAILIYSVLMSLVQLIRLILPFALKGMNSGEVTGLAGIAFSVGGFASAFGVLFLSARLFRVGRFRQMLAAGFAGTTLAYVMMALSGTVPLYIAAFGLISLVQAVMIPPINALIAFNTPEARRGTAFGIAAAGQALATVMGPAGATFIAATSYTAGYAAIAFVCGTLALLTFILLREPGEAARPVTS